MLTSALLKYIIRGRNTTQGRKSDMRITYYDGSSDLPYCHEATEYMTVSYCDISDHRPPRQYYDMHTTERKNGRTDYYILFVISGSITVTFDGMDFPAKKGDLVIYYPNTPQKVVKRKADNPANYWVHFNGYAIPEILSQCGLSKNGVYTVGKVDVISDIFKQMILAQRLAKNKIQINSLFMRLLSEIASSEETMMPRAASQISPANRIVQGIIQMEWEYKKPRRISEYAKLCGMSSGRFSVVFKEATGKTPQRFIEEVRITKAREMLINTSLSISSVAENVGFRDPLYFSRVFKRSVGISPTEYRKGKLYFEKQER